MVVLGEQAVATAGSAVADVATVRLAARAAKPVATPAVLANVRFIGNSLCSEGSLL
jgi:hypothetical protein